MDEETAFELVKAVASHLDALAREYRLFRGISVDSLRQSNIVSLHPGAERFYMETDQQGK